MIAVAIVGVASYLVANFRVWLDRDFIIFVRPAHGPGNWEVGFDILYLGYLLVVLGLATRALSWLRHVSKSRRSWVSVPPDPPTPE